jgi:hypothetical protein
MTAGAPGQGVVRLIGWLTRERPASGRFALLFFAALSGVLNLDKLLLGPGAPMRFHDSFEADFPRIINTARDLEAYGLVEWYPHALGGMPANAYHFPTVHPLVLLSTFVPPWALYHGMVILYGMLAGYGFYRFVREFFELDHFHGLLGGILFVLVTTFHISGVIFIPFMFLFPVFLWLLHGRSDGRHRVLQLLGRGLALAVLALSSYPINVLAKFTIVHAVVLGAVFLLRRRVDWSMIAPAVLYWGGLTILFLPTFLPLLDFAEIASRTYQASSVAGTAGLMTAVFVDLPLTILKALVFVELFQIQVLLVRGAGVFGHRGIRRPVLFRRLSPGFRLLPGQDGPPLREVGAALRCGAADHRGDERCADDRKEGEDRLSRAPGGLERRKFDRVQKHRVLPALLPGGFVDRAFHGSGSFGGTARDLAVRAALAVAGRHRGFGDCDARRRVGGGSAASPGSHGLRPGAWPGPGAHRLVATT